jgi:hypothetical protein
MEWLQLMLNVLLFVTGKHVMAQLQLSEASKQPVWAAKASWSSQKFSRDGTL